MFWQEFGAEEEEDDTHGGAGCQIHAANFRLCHPFEGNEHGSLQRIDGNKSVCKGKTLQNFLFYQVSFSVSDPFGCSKCDFCEGVHCYRKHNDQREFCTAILHKRQNDDPHEGNR